MTHSSWSQNSIEAEKGKGRSKKERRFCCQLFCKAFVVTYGWAVFHQKPSRCTQVHIAYMPPGPDQSIPSPPFGLQKIFHPTKSSQYEKLFPVELVVLLFLYGGGRYSSLKGGEFAVQGYEQPLDQLIYTILANKQNQANIIRTKSEPQI